MKNTDLNKKCRKMQLTINNPQKPATTVSEKGLNNVEDTKNYIDETGLIKDGDYYCFSFERGLKEATPHIHVFFCFKSPRYGKVIKEKFPTAHVEFCNGSNQENRDYVYKTGKWEGNEKEGTRIEGMQYENKEIPAERGQGKRTDLESIKDLIDNGMTPREVLETNPNYYKFDKYIGEMFYNKRLKETPMKRDVEVIIHTGVAGAGKSNVLTTLLEDRLFIGADYSSALFDNYEAQEILFLDEFRGQIPYNQLLVILDGYKMPVHARYYNKYALWNEVHITSVIPVEDWYNNDNIRDTFEQLKRRVGKIVFHIMYNKADRTYIADKMEFLKSHSKNEIGYTEYAVDAARYTTYEDLEKEALSACNILLPHGEAWEDVAAQVPTLEEEFNMWKESNNPFNVVDEEQLFDMFWNEKVKKAKAAA